MNDDLGKSESALIVARRDNLAALRSRGNDPFVRTRFEVDATAAGLADRYAALAPEERAQGESWSLAGRVMSKRGMGKTIFADLRDRTGRLQIYVRKDELGDGRFADWVDLDIGDIVGVRGFMFRSKMGELTLHVTDFAVLAKAMLPLPDKWHGLTDVEKRYRQRYVDLIVNPGVRETFALRSRIVAETRRFIDAAGFYEVETPTLLHVAGGAAARPFVTHVNALDARMQMRIATELNLKRLIVGGLERVFELGRVFRNEGLDTHHNPEFTMLEAYQAYGDYHEMMELTEALVVNAARMARKDTVIKIRDREVDLAKPFRRATMVELIKEKAGVDINPAMPVDEARRVLDGLGISYSNSWGAGKLTNQVYDERVEG
ncbi:MAG: lysine--tRNA ligase, partial [Rhodanobacteraceae bacterium]